MNIATLKATLIEKIKSACTCAFGEAPAEIEVGFPPEVKLGHFGVGCFPLARLFRRSPAEIASQLADKLVTDKFVETVTAAGPYLNVSVSPTVLCGTVCDEILGLGQAYGESQIGMGKRVMDEYLSPNTNKPLHLGHLRNGALGMAIARMFAATGHEVVKAILVNDRGVHICKSMLAWQRWGDGETPQSAGTKGDHFVGDWYVRYAMEFDKNPALEKEVQQMLQRWEAGHAETVALWRTMNDWVYDGFSKTYREFGLEFDVTYYESDTYKLGKDYIQTGLKNGVFTEDANGNVVFLLPEDRFGLEKGGQPKRVTVLRPDGTPVRPGSEEVGEIVASGESITAGYFGDPDGSQEFFRDGKLYTGDLARVDADGYLYLGDRVQDMILSGGANIYPAEVEAAISEHPAVHSCAVIGLPNDDRGNDVHAIVQADAGELSDGDLLAFLAERLTTYKLPRSIEFVDEPLRDEAGKVRRSTLRAARI